MIPREVRIAAAGGRFGRSDSDSIQRARRYRPGGWHTYLEREYIVISMQENRSFDSLLRQRFREVVVQ